MKKVENKNDEAKILEALAAEGILGGLPLGNGRILWCATEMNKKEEMDKIASICKKMQYDTCPEDIYSKTCCREEVTGA